MSEIVEAFGISHGSVVLILNHHLDMRKPSPRWVPRLLTIDHQSNRLTDLKWCLAFLNSNTDEVGLSANLIIVTVFPDASDIIRIDYLQKGKTINGQYYAYLLEHFN